MFDRILVPIDLQRAAQSTALLKAARGLAEEFGSTVHVVTVIPGYGMTIVANYFPADAKATAKRELEQSLAAFVEKSGLKATTSVAEGKRAEEILKTARRRRSDLILVGCQPHGRVQDTLLGSVGTKVAQRASCSVLVVRG